MMSQTGAIPGGGDGGDEISGDDPLITLQQL